MLVRSARSAYGPAQRSAVQLRQEWVMLEPQPMFAARPLHPRKRTSVDHFVMSQKCQHGTHALQQAELFDQLTGAAAQRDRGSKAERLCDLEVDGKSDRKTQNAICVTSRSRRSQPVTRQSNSLAREVKTSLRAD